MAQKVDIKRPDYQLFYPLATRWHDNDVYGHVNNVTYYSYFDTAVNNFLVNHCGLDFKEGGVIGLVVSSGCEYLSSISFPDNIEVGVRVDHLGRSSVRYSVAVFKEKEVQASAFGHFVHVFVDRLSGKSVGIPDRMRRKLSKLEANARSKLDSE